MKKELSKYNILLDSISKSSIFKLLLILSFMTIIYGINLSNNINNYFLSILIPFTFSYFNIMVILLIFINSINTSNIIKNNYNYLIRISSRKKSMLDLIITNIIVNVIFIIVFLLIFIALISFNKLQYLYFSVIESYNLNILIYIIFYIFRYIILLILISTIFVLVYNKYNKISYILSMILLFGLLFTTNNKVLNTFQILPWRYFEIITYKRFIMEISYSILYIILLIIIITFLYYKNIKERNNLTYFFRNDLEIFKKKHSKILILILILPTICAIACGSKELSIDYIFQTSLGLNINNNNNFILSKITYILNILILAYLSISLFIKDYKNITNIYLRYDYKKFFILKSINLIKLFFLLKLYQYIVVFFINKIIYKGTISNIIMLFVKDNLFNIMISLTMIFIYILFKIEKTKRLLLIPIISIITYYFIIKQQTITNINIPLLLMIIIFEIFITNKYIIKNNKKITQELGEI